VLVQRRINRGGLSGGNRDIGAPRGDELPRLILAVHPAVVVHIILATHLPAAISIHAHAHAGIALPIHSHSLAVRSLIAIRVSAAK
jgi:hypothetical protein